MDFVHDQLATGKKIRVLTVVDTFSRFSPIIDPWFSYRAQDVVAALERTCSTIGYPTTIRVDQGSEFVSRDLDLWAYTNGVTLEFSRPGKHWEQRRATRTLLLTGGSRGRSPQKRIDELMPWALIPQPQT